MCKNEKKNSFAFEVTTTISKYENGNCPVWKSFEISRQISLYYGGGRIDKKLFDVMVHGFWTFYESINSLMYMSISLWHVCAIVESRLDVLLLRSNFVDSISCSWYIFHVNAMCKVITNHTSAFLIQNFNNWFTWLL